MPCARWFLYLLGLISVHEILDLYGVSHENIGIAYDGVRLGRCLQSGGRKIVPPLLDYGVAFDIDKHTVLLEYAVMLPCVLPVDLPMAHTVTS